MNAERPILDIRGLRAWYETPAGILPAVADMTLAVRAGQALGVVGESGSGKTQTFFSVLGLSHGWPGLVGGAARFGDTEILEGIEKYVTITPGGNGTGPKIAKQSQRWSAIHNARLEPILGRELALMFQDAKGALVPYWTIGQHLRHVLRRANNGQEPAAGAAEDLLTRFGFRRPGEVLAKHGEQLSGGEAQRAMMAIAMATRPRLLIADEPTTALDAVNQLRVLAELERIHKESQVALVMISHDLAVVRRVVSDVVVVFGGTVVERAPVSLLTSSSTDSVHPYSVELRESQRRRALGQPIAGAERGAMSARRTVGCPYADRCSLRPKLSAAMSARCGAEAPVEVKVADDHHVACWGLAA